MRVLTVAAVLVATASTVVLGATPAMAETADPSACVQLAVEKPAEAPVLRVGGSGLAVRLPAESRGCDRVVRVLDQDGQELLLPVSAGARRVAVPARAAGVYAADFKVVAVDVESTWSGSSAPVTVTGSAPSRHPVRALRAAAQRGGALISWSTEDRASVTRYRVAVRCGGHRVLRATVDAAVTSLWVPVEPASACRAEVAAVGADGGAGAVSRVDVVAE